MSGGPGAGGTSANNVKAFIPGPDESQTLAEFAWVQGQVQQTEDAFRGGLRPVDGSREAVAENDGGIRRGLTHGRKHLFPWEINRSWVH